MEISGHKTRSVFDRYNMVSEDDHAKQHYSQAQSDESKVVAVNATGTERAQS